jgi:ribosomal protein S27E
MRPVRCPRATYQRHQPERTVLYRTIATHLPTFFARPAWEDGTGGWPAFVRREFEAYLKCGRLEHGLLRVQCERCGDTTVVAFSCRGRGFCPSCGELAHPPAAEPTATATQGLSVVELVIGDRLDLRASIRLMHSRVFLHATCPQRAPACANRAP